jgi:hypothetical protein
MDARDDILVFLLRGVALVCFTLLLTLILGRVHPPRDSGAIRRMRLALTVSMSGWITTQGIIAVQRAISLAHGTYTPSFDIQAVIVAAIAMIVGITYVWALWPFSGGRRGE